ncbi:MAG TPA: preprotein translocase subunit SecG [Spirochaetota bacterium]|nr:preprotein translocase subunit SecG [Spirochaetota bacterium]HPI88157.1 preprotein translocase subunit SecG [Spirochaetota bacterium]HPR47932.1 preprotein translocase subunit SecG [Spirochaetota bacterium]
MSILLSISTVLFVILCVFLVIIVLLQSDKSAGMGILGGSSQSAFGSSTADVITKVTSVMVALFFVGALGLAVLDSQVSSSLEKKVLQSDEEKEGVIRDVAPQTKEPADTEKPAEK